MKTKATTANSLSNEKTEDITISELFEYWLMAEKDGSVISKPRNFFLYYKSYLAEPFGKRRVNDISYEEWKEYKQKLSNTHETWEDEITAAISQRIFDAFGKAFSYGRKEFGLNKPDVKKQNPLPDDQIKVNNRMTVKAAILQEQQKQQQQSIENSKKYIFSSEITEVFTDDEVEKMKSCLIGYNSTHLCVMLSLFAGISHSEICALKWQDVSVDGKTLNISKTYLRRQTHEEDSVTALGESVPKGPNGVRSVLVPEWLAEMLAPLKAIYNGEAYLLTGNTEPVGPSTLCYQYYPRFLEWAGVPQYSFPALRNTFVKRCFENGMDIPKIMQLIGSSDIKKTIKKYFEIKTTDEK